MKIQTSCPKCKASYSLKESMRWHLKQMLHENNIETY